MTTEQKEGSNPYEHLSPSKRLEELRRLMGMLPMQLTKDEPQMVENLKYLNDLAKLLEFIRGTRGLVTNILRDAAYATEFGLDGLNDMSGETEAGAIQFPDTLFLDVGTAGPFDELSVQHVEQREIARLSRRRAINRMGQDHVLFVRWSVMYEDRYHQKPTDEIVNQEALSPIAFEDTNLAN